MSPKEKITINDFCRLVGKINEVNEKLHEAHKNFYDGGHSFEECHGDLLDEQAQYHEDFKEAFQYIKETLI